MHCLNIVAFLIDYEVAAHIRKVSELRAKGMSCILHRMSGWTFNEHARTGILPDEYGDISDLCVGEYCSSFTGQCSSYSSGMSDTPINRVFCQEPIAYIRPSQPIVDPCFAAYESPDALKDEYRKRLAWARLPDDFDWWAHIVKIKGEMST